MIYVIHNNKGILLQYTGIFAIYCPSTFYEPCSEKNKLILLFLLLFALKTKYHKKAISLSSDKFGGGGGGGGGGFDETTMVD